MRILLQRVSEASVEVDNEIISSIGKGYLLLVGVREGDTEAEAQWLAAKIAGLRLFEDENSRFNLGIKDVGGEILVISQFTLYGDARKGRRPSFSHAAPPEIAEPLCSRFAQFLRDENLIVKEGVFGAMMKVHLVNDGPVTLTVEKDSNNIM